MADMGIETTEDPLHCPAFTNRPSKNILKDEQWKRHSLYHNQSEEEFGPAIWRAECLCGKNIYLLKQDKPLNAKFCHCRGCQITHGAPFQWASIFHKHDMLFTSDSGGLVFYSATHQSQEYGLPTKVSCSNCRTLIMDEERNVCLIFPQLIVLEGTDDEQRVKREAFKPTCHIFYESFLKKKRDAQLDAEQDSSGQKSTWRSVYSLMRCALSTCPSGGADPVGKKHYQLNTYHLRRLVTYVEKGGILDGHNDVPEAVREELYMEEQQRQENSSRKGGHFIGNGVPYPPININVLLSQSSAPGIDISGAQAAADLTSLSPLEIPGPRDEAVKEYGEWQVSNVTDDPLKAAFRQI
ncbi:hypothetical protein N7508_007525 [Penicillium antarcticum]|uniref:uncharacterized protein n=1 Tax=Penicillium antarcticum TaxID=416450 RepID=UPI00238C7898|nr:uncharacterized protein N7508_007525 [Penicillium antarcticum]KAJ5300282.1 hypothetical protein N7508_007525 [Penicillium antarcticum]